MYNDIYSIVMVLIYTANDIIMFLSLHRLANCFTGRGRGYNGTINTTRSGRTCQRWSEQAPHQFILPSSQYPEIAGGHNYCRNPGSRAPEGPWCFTTDPNTRWEYCDVPKCGKTLKTSTTLHINSGASSLASLVWAIPLCNANKL